MKKEELPYFRKRGFRGFWCRVILSSDNNELDNLNKTSDKAEALLNEYVSLLTHSKRQCLLFSIYIEKEVDYFKQSDSFKKEGIYYSSDLSCHIAYDKFLNANQTTRVKLILSACVYLLHYWIDHYTIPKFFDLIKTTNEIEQFLTQKNSLIPTTNLIIKPNNNTEFRFIITRGLHVNNDEISYDLSAISRYLTNNLALTEYGDGIRKFKVGYEIYKLGYKDHSFFNSPENYFRYDKNNKVMIIVTKFNYDYQITISPDEQWHIFTKRIFNALEYCHQQKRTPKTFEFKIFKDDIITLLNNYK